MPKTKGDWLCITILMISLVSLRFRFLGVLIQGVDEQQYLAKACYLIKSNISAFSTPYGPAYSNVIYTFLGTLFRPYDMTPIRSLILLFAMCIAFIVFVFLKNLTNRWIGLIGGLLFTHYHFYFSGIQANLEWFAIPPLFLGVGVFCWSQSQKDRLKKRFLFASGFFCFVSVWFKSQSSPMLITVPLMLLYDGIVGKQLRAHLRLMGFYLVGCGTAALLYLLPFFIAGTLSEYLRFITGFHLNYVFNGFGGQGIAVSSKSSPDFMSYLSHFYLDIPFPSLLFIIYIFALVVTVVALFGSASKPFSKSTLLRHSWVRTFVTLFFTSMFAIQLGGRFYAHYYQYVIPTFAILFGCALHELFNVQSTKRSVLIFGPLFAVLFFEALGLSRYMTVNGPPPPKHMIGWIVSFGVTTVLFIILMFHLSERPRLWLKNIVLVALCLVFMNLIFQTQTKAWQTSVKERIRYPALLKTIESMKQEEDRLFVWGWRPEIYTLSKITPASQFTTTSYIVQDYIPSLTGRPTIHTHRLNILINELTNTSPKFIVDASKVSITHATQWFYHLDFCRPLTDFINENYKLFGRYDKCDLYIRR